MVLSPAYPCQLVLATKLIAVLSAESGATGPRPAGFSGRAPCARCKAYTASTPSTLNASTDRA